MLYSNQRNGLMSAGTLVYVLVGCLACWAMCFVRSMGYPIQEEAGEPPIWRFLCGQLSSATQAYAVGFVLMAGGAFLVHRANYVLMLIREKTYLPILIYVLLVSTNEDFLPLKATSFGVFFTILAIYELFTAYPDRRILYYIHTIAAIYLHFLDRKNIYFAPPVHRADAHLLAGGVFRKKPV